MLCSKFNWCEICWVIETMNISDRSISNIHYPAQTQQGKYSKYLFKVQISILIQIFQGKKCKNIYAMTVGKVSQVSLGLQKHNFNTDGRCSRQNITWNYDLRLNSHFLFSRYIKMKKVSLHFAWGHGKIN